MQAPTHKRIGTLIVAIAVIWQGVGTSLVGKLVDPSRSTFLTFSAFLAAAGISLLAYLFTRKKNSAAPRSALSRKTALSLNIFTAGAFCLFYISATMVPPAAASVIETGVGPLIVAFIMVIAVKNTSGLKTLFAPVLVVFLAAIFVALQDIRYNAVTIAGILLAILAGSSAVGVLYSSQAAVREGASVLQVAAIRFHLAWVVSGIIVVFTAQNSLAGGNIFQNVGLSVVCVTLPILLLQWGITIASPLASSLVIAWLPAIVLGTDVLLGASVTFSQVVILFAIVCVSIAPVLLSKKVQA